MTTARQCLTVVCDTYWPEATSTAQLMTDLTESLVSDFHVEVLTSHQHAEAASTIERGRGVKIRRLPATSFAKASRAGRLANWLSFTASAAVAICMSRRKRTYLFLTNPPTAPWLVPLTRTLGHQAYVLVYDLYPDLAEAIGAVKKGGLVARAFDAANRIAFRRATGLIALGEDMRRRLDAKVAGATPITIIPNWADGGLINPRPKATSRFALAHGLTERFVFLYAGNLGLFQDLETLAAAVDELPGGSIEPLLVFVGDGGKRRRIEELARKSRRVRLFDRVPYEDLGDLYAAADVGLIALEAGVGQANVPSKTYSILSAGKPFLAVCDTSADLAALVEQGCGVCVPNEPASVAAAMSSFMADSALRESMAASARRVFESDFSRSIAAARYRLMLSGKRSAA